MLNLKIARRGRRLLIVSPFAARETLANLPGRRWHAKVRCWSVPATPEAAGAFHLAFKEHHVEDQGGYGDLLARYWEAVSARELHDAEDLPPLPDEATGTRARSWLHQRQAYAVAKAHDGFLFQMGMGTGKTRVAANLLDGEDTIVVICPDKVTQVWPFQMKLWSDRPWHVAWHGGISSRSKKPLKNVTLKGRVKEAERLLALADVRHEPFMVVVPYSNCWQEPVRSWLIRLVEKRKAALVMDESHNAKAPGGKWALFCQVLGKRCHRRLLMTGTAMPHSKLDIYAQARVIDEGLFGTSFKNFRARYAVMGGFEDRKVVGWINADEFVEKLASFSYIVDSDDVLDLPEYHHLDPETSPQLGAELGPDARRIYTELDDDFIADVGKGVVVAKNALSRMLRLAQVTSGHVAVEGEPDEEGLIEKTVEVIGSEKHDAVEAWLTEIPADEPVVMFCRFKHDLAMMRAIAAKLDRPYGEVSGRSNDLAEGGRYPEGVTLLGVQIQAGAEGIDLTRARYCGYVSTGFDNGKYQQSIRRVHRPGQERPTIFVHFLVGDSIDWTEYNALKARQSAIEAVLAAAKARAAVG